MRKLGQLVLDDGLVVALLFGQRLGTHEVLARKLEPLALLLDPLVDVFLARRTVCDERCNEDHTGGEAEGGHRRKITASRAQSNNLRHGRAKPRGPRARSCRG